MENVKTSTIGLVSDEKVGDPFVLTRKQACGPFSFFDRTKNDFKETCPPPVYLNLSEINAKKSYAMESVLADIKVEKNGEFKLTNEDLKERNKGVISDILKKFTTKIVEGKSVVGISAPVRIFEARSHMERLIDCLQFFPYYMNLAANTTDTVERIKYVLTSVFASCYHNLSQWKPFNPLLGETYQGSLGPDTKVFMEHVSHHPPMSAVYVTSPKFKIYGTWTYNAKFGPNKVSIFSEGFLTVEFLDGQKIRFFIPSAQLRGIIIGAQTLRFVHSFFAYEEVSGIKGVVTFSDGSTGKNFLSNMFSKGKVDVVSGSIYQYDEKIHNKIMGYNWYKLVKESDTPSDKKEEIVKITGSLLGQLVFNETIYWNLENNKNDFLQQMATDNPLPSDFRFREDIIWMFYGNEKYAQEWKFQLEIQQRKDRANRKSTDKE